MTANVPQGPTTQGAIQGTIQGSAKIYQFPLGGRKAVGGYRTDAMPAADLRPSFAPAVAVGSGWYHDAAIQESSRVRER